MLEVAGHEIVGVYRVVSIVFDGVLSVSLGSGVYYFGCVPAGGNGGVWFLPPHGYLVTLAEGVGVTRGGGRVPVLNPS